MCKEAIQLNTFGRLRYCNIRILEFYFMANKEVYNFFDWKMIKFYTWPWVIADTCFWFGNSRIHWTRWQIFHQVGFYYYFDSSFFFFGYSVSIWLISFGCSVTRIKPKLFHYLVQAGCIKLRISPTKKCNNLLVIINYYVGINFILPQHGRQLGKARGALPPLKI